MARFDSGRFAAYAQRERKRYGAESKGTGGKASWALGFHRGDGSRRRSAGRAPREHPLVQVLHLALALEDDALLDHQRRTLDVAAHLRRVVQLDRVLGPHVSLHLAVHDDAAAGDLGGNLGALTDDEHIARDDGAGELAVDPYRSLEGQLALELGASPEQGVQLARRAGAAGHFLTLQYGHGLALLAFGGGDDRLDRLGRADRFRSHILPRLVPERHVASRLWGWTASCRPTMRGVQNGRYYTPIFASIPSSSSSDV